MPCFLNAPGCPTGSQFLIGADGTPLQIPGNTTAYDFTCNIPRRDGKLRPALYGHGLLGGQGEIDQGQLKDLSVEHGFLFCAVDWNGMAFKDIPNVLTVLQDVALPDARRPHPAGLPRLPAPRPRDDPPRRAQPTRRSRGKIDTSELFYDGNSQGGIYGGALTAIAPDFRARGARRARHELLDAAASQRRLRHVRAQGDFEGAETPVGLYDSYPDELERPLVFGSCRCCGTAPTRTATRTT